MILNHLGSDLPAASFFPLVRPSLGHTGVGLIVVELNVQPDHVHLVLMIPPKVAVSDLLGRMKAHPRNLL
jgi:hypothetical protein